MVYGYARVSTFTQGKSGNSLEEQEQTLIKAGCGQVVKEIFTGMKTNRPIFLDLLSHLQSGDVLMITKLDRFARTAIEGCQIVQELIRKGVKVHILNIGLVEDTPMGRLILTTMLAFSEFERDMIIERTQAGKEIAKKNSNYRDGRPKLYKRAQISHAMELLMKHTYREVEEMTGISKSTLIRARREQKKCQIGTCG